MGDSKSLSFLYDERSESTLSSCWTVFWLLVKLLPICCCWLLCSVVGGESSDWEQGGSLQLLWLAAVSDEEALVFSGTDTAGPRLSRLNGVEIIESTDRTLHLLNSENNK